MKSVEGTVTNGTITAQLKTCAGGTLRLYYTKDGGKNFTKVNIEKVIRKKLGLAENMPFSIYSSDFFGDLFTMTGYYYDEEEAIHYFVLTSSNMKTYTKRDMPEIENSGNYLPYLAKFGTQYIWRARQEYWSEVPSEVTDYRFTYYAGKTITKLQKKVVTAAAPLTGENLTCVRLWSGINDKTGMTLTYSGYDEEGYLTDVQMLLTKDLKKWTKPISLWDEKTWSWSASVTDGGTVVYNQSDDPKYAQVPGDNPGLISVQAYDGAGKKIGFRVKMERLGYLDCGMSVIVTTKEDAIQYVTVFDRNGGSHNFGEGVNCSLAFTISKDGKVEAHKVPFQYNDGYTDGIRMQALDTKNGVYFVADYSGNVHMSKDGFASVVTFRMPENGGGILGFNVVGDYLIFDTAQKTYKVKLATLYKNFK